MSELTTPTPIEEKVAKRSKPPFKLNFVLRQELGRSYISSSKPPCLGPVLSPKFYSQHDNFTLEAPEMEKVLNEVYTAYKTGPKQKYKEPVLENQRYGWYIEPLIDVDKSDTRLHFPLRTSAIAKLQAEISRIKQLMHY